MSQSTASWLRQIISADHPSFEDDFRSYEPDHAEEYERVDFEQHLIRIIDEKLTSFQREVLFLRYWKEKSLQEIAIICGTSKQAVGQIIKRSLKRILKNL